MKFQPPAPGPAAPAPGGNPADGTFDVTPAVIGSILIDVSTRADTHVDQASGLATTAQEIAEVARAWPIAEQMGSLNTYVFQRYMTIIAARTYTNINAVADVVTILTAADQQMGDTARASAALAAQDVLNSDPLADPNAPVDMGHGPAAVQ